MMSEIDLNCVTQQSSNAFTRLDCVSLAFASEQTGAPRQNSTNSAGFADSCRPRS